MSLWLKGEVPSSAQVFVIPLLTVFYIILAKEMSNKANFTSTQSYNFDVHQSFGPTSKLLHHYVTANTC